MFRKGHRLFKFIKIVFRQLFFSFITILFFFSVINPPSVLSVEYGGIGGRPAFPRSDNPRTESIFVHTVNPGDAVQEGVKVINNTAETKILMVYAVDSVVSSGGAFACGQLGDPMKGVGNWITLEKGEVTLGSLKSEVVPFSIQIPAKVSVGEHNGCIVVQEKKKDTDSKDSGSGVSLTFRTGLRVALMVPGEIERKLQIAGFEILPKKNGNLNLHPRVRNLGNVSIDTEVKVVTSYFFGSELGRHGGQFPILRDETSEWNFELKKPFWGGWYKAVLAVTYDENPEAGVGIKSGKSLTTLTGSTVWFFSFPTTKGLVVEIVVLLIIISVIFWLWLAAMRKRWIKREWVFYDIQTGDDVKSLAEKNKASWKILVKANKLKPPYTLSPGQRIKIPPSDSETK
ncbi:LysM peptidoglycan-binding domain-containing protein [Patescibacteria group bacterium]|nr:LysM peptidoglycan-binding domain-containing protein [Patescibacteria group bacterium]